MQAAVYCMHVLYTHEHAQFVYENCMHKTLTMCIKMVCSNMPKYGEFLQFHILASTKSALSSIFFSSLSRLLAMVRPAVYCFMSTYSAIRRDSRAWRRNTLFSPRAQSMQPWHSDTYSERGIGKGSSHIGKGRQLHKPFILLRCQRFCSCPRIDQQAHGWVWLLLL